MEGASEGGGVKWMLDGLKKDFFGPSNYFFDFLRKSKN